MTKKVRYEKVAKYKGIRKDVKNGQFLATKYINGREYSKKFSVLKDAINWRNVFHPSIPESVVESEMNLTPKIKVRQNGEDFGYRLSDVWELYVKLYLTSLERSTLEVRLANKKFFVPLFEFKMIEITADLLDRFIEQHKENAIKLKSRRANFDNDLKYLKALLNWYRENYDPLFVNPVLKRHKTAGIIRKLVKRDKKMKAEDVLLFFEQLSPFWRDFAETQFYMAARVGEIAGLQVKSIDFQERAITVKHVAIWNRRTKHLSYLKEYPKNGDERYIFLNDKLFEILSRRVPLAKDGFIFHDEGVPLSYRQIQHHYNLALKKADLFPQFSSTHIMRHSMGTITRKVTGSLDAAQAVTGHKDIRLAQHYATMPTDTNKKAVNDVNRFMNQLEKPKTNSVTTNPVLTLVKKN